ncbi:glycine-rich protein 2-like [Pyrus ussuriensis x Pyrus communis]|uniref:Glycine-rich protein 2-like n=1 Tax=Pyrus ussuriensis x Pyrus communis TaxID=2448454 RepID=A0A5N5IN00_9ROSA|nr:glycine-rich protein 2-like [Pyrus ussuriensis x Pyrus communis]
MAAEVTMEVAIVVVVEEEVLLEASTSALSPAIARGSTLTRVEPITSTSPSFCICCWSVWFLLN